MPTATAATIWACERGKMDRVIERTEKALRRGEEQRRQALSLLATLPEDSPEAAHVRVWLAEHKQRTEMIAEKLNRYAGAV